MTTDIAENRAWDELRRAGRELATCSDLDAIARVIAWVMPYFEVLRSASGESANVFLDGLAAGLDAIENAALFEELLDQQPEASEAAKDAGDVSAAAARPEAAQ
jgi:hypothetical protein